MTNIPLPNATSGCTPYGAASSIVTGPSTRLKSALKRAPSTIDRVAEKGRTQTTTTVSPSLAATGQTGCVVLAKKRFVGAIS